MCTFEYINHMHDLIMLLNGYCNHVFFLDDAYKEQGSLSQENSLAFLSNVSQVFCD